ncbi:uncharacterized protein LOC144644637 isoform X1 [Oculina patagonica]
MGCGSSTYPADLTNDDGLGNNVEDANRNTKPGLHKNEFRVTVRRDNNKQQQEIIHAASKVEEVGVQEKHASSQTPKKLDVAKTLDQNELTKSEDESASNKVQNSKSVTAAATEQSNENNKDTNAEKVLQAAYQGESCTVLSRIQGDKNVTSAKDKVTATDQNKSGDSIPGKDGSCSSTDQVKKATHDEKDLTIDRTTATSFDPDICEDKNLSSNNEKTEEKKEKEPTNSAIITCNAAETTAEKSSSLDTELQVSENQSDSVDKASDHHPGPCVNSNQGDINEMALDQGQVSKTNFATVLQTTDNLEDPDQSKNNLVQEEDEPKQKSTDETAVEMKSEKSSDEYESKLKPESTLPQSDDTTSSEALMAETLEISAEKNSELSCMLPQQEINTNANNDSSTAAIPCGERHQPQMEDSGSLSVTDEVKSNETEASHSMPSRDINSENKLITALRLSCKLSPGHLVKDLDVKGVMSIHLMRSLSPGVVTVAELVRKLVCLTELDLSGNLLGPQGFRVICLALRRNTTLKCLNLANNLADTDSSECIGIMLSTNSTLERLDVSGNNLGSDYFSRCVGPALRINKSLKALTFSSCGSSDVSAICEAIAEDNVTIEELNASNNHVGAVFGEGLSNILQKPGCCLRHLDVHGTNLGREGMTTLLAGIQQNSSLITLNAAGHQVSCLSFLMEFLYSCICHPTLEELIIENTKVLEHDEWQRQGVSVAETSSNLTKLLLSGCSLTNQALRTLSEKNQGKLSCLAFLDLSSNEQLTTECLSSVCAMMTSSPGQSCPLSFLDFSLNPADDIAVDVEKLPQLKNLKSLLLKKCRITPTSVADLSKLITTTTPDFLPLSSLTLDGIKLSGTDALKGMLGLSDMFIPTSPCSLELLSLVGCGLNDRDVKPLMSAIRNGLIIKELRLSANRLTDTAVSYLVDASETLLSLQVLDLSINKIRNGGAEKLAEALSDKLSNLKNLLLADNCIGKAGILALVGKIGSASQLGVLNLKSQQQALGEEDMDEIMEQLAKSLGFEPENSEDCVPAFNLPSNFTINLTGLGGEPGELGPKLDSQAILTDYSAKHRRTLTLEDALQLSAVLSHSEGTRAKLSQSDWDRVISADKDAPAWLQLSSQRECAVYISNLPLSVTAEKLEGQLDSEAECNVMEVYLLKDQILRKPNGLAWVLFTDTESVQRAVEYYNSGQAFMYGTPFVISSVTVDVTADTGSEDNAEAKARQEMIQRAEDRKADQTVHAQLVLSNYNESLARHEYAAQHPAYADGRVW